MKKIQYELDPYNRLVILGSGKKSALHKFRQVIDGKFKLDKDNNLSYRVKAPLPEADNIPHQIKLRGEWSLTPEHQLRLTLDGQGRQTFGDQITLQGEILDVNKSSLLFALTTTTKDNVRSTYVINLEGAWKADENNRLSFRVRRESGRYDILTFSGAWEIDKNHQIIYQYEKARLIKKKREVHALTFKGYWDIKNALRISYLLGKGTDSSFDFATSAGIFRENYIKYELGIGLADRIDPVRRTVTLSGRWNLKKDCGLVFEVDYENNRKKRLAFGAEARLTDRDTVSFKLKSDMDEKDMGIELELSHKLLKGDGEAYLRLLKNGEESAVLTGAAWRW
jgi:hypothetical protein